LNELGLSIDKPFACENVEIYEFELTHTESKKYEEVEFD
jgi:hypothetical protein